MTNEELNEELAEIFGFQKEEPWLNGRKCWSHKDSPSHIGFEEIPNFAGNLNVINSYWRRLSPDQKIKYKENLREIVFRESLGMEYVSLSDIENDRYGICENASPRVRARAMIETLALPKAFIPHEECISAGNPNRRFLRCENCNKVVDVNEDSHHEGCDFVYGRRGWRQLGAYDG